VDGFPLASQKLPLRKELMRGQKKETLYETTLHTPERAYGRNS